jgi:hypothetical protein
MEMKMPTVVFALQGTVPAKAPPGTNDAYTISREDLQALRNQVRQSVRAQIAGATEGATPAQGGAPTPPMPPTPITIRGSDGKTTYIGLPPGFARNVIPQQAVDISIAFFLTMAFIIVGLPLARAFARRMDRRSAGPSQIPGEVTAQLSQLNQAVDAIALEVERISEGQRFTTRLLSEQRDAARQTLPSTSDR